MLEVRIQPPLELAVQPPPLSPASQSRYFSGTWSSGWPLYLPNGMIVRSRSSRSTAHLHSPLALPILGDTLAE